MTAEEKKRYMATSSRRSVCVYREQVNDAPQLVQSVYLSGTPEDCHVSFEFDPLDMVDDGEGWVWTAEMVLVEAIQMLETHFGVAVEEWENVSRTGRLDQGIADPNAYGRDEEYFREKLRLGNKLLPTGPKWNGR